MLGISLVFDYNFDKQMECGRTWGKQGYKSKDHIFEYSAASFATFAHHNKDIDFVHEVMTDDEKLIREKMDKYDVDWSKLKIIENKELLREWIDHSYCLYPTMMHLKMYKDKKCQLLRLDNDLECLKSLKDLKNSDNFYAWKRERNVNEGKERWGERLACRKAFNTDNFSLYNIGVFIFPPGDKSSLIDEITEAGLKVSEQDISKVVYFPEKPKLKVKVLSWSDQTGLSWVIHKNKIKIETVEDYIEHHCYGFDVKKKCIEAAKYLLKN